MSCLAGGGKSTENGKNRESKEAAAAPAAQQTTIHVNCLIY